MATETTSALPSLYLEDETAWLETMAELINQRRFGEIDFEHLSEYLSDMAKRDKREVRSRLVVLLTHLLKWDHQPRKRSRSWKGTILTQIQDLRDILDSRTLRNHAADILPDCYERARKLAAVETGLKLNRFPAKGPSSVDEVFESGERVDYV